MSISGALDSVKQFFIGIWNDFVEFVHSVLLTLLDLLKEVLYFQFDIFSQLMMYALEGVGYLFEALDLVQYINGIPDDAKNLMGLIGVGQALGIIAVSLGIRFMLQLIPFIRLGS